MQIAVAAPSTAALDAAMRVAAEGGGAVDAAIAAAIVAFVNEMGVCAPGAGGFVTVGGTHRATTYDGYTAVPGVGLDPDTDLTDYRIEMGYGGGVTTVVGPASVGTPGIWSALAAAHRDHGQIPWERLPRPAADLARDGCRLGSAVFTYLVHSHEAVFGHDRAAWSLIHDRDGSLIDPDTEVVMSDLASTLDLLGREGVETLYGGALGKRIADDLAERGGRLTRRDLAEYEAIRRDPARVVAGGWEMDTNPSPAVGGEAVAAVLDLLAASPRDAMAHVAAQREVFERRFRGDPIRSPSTIHVSVVDRDGVGCAVTASSGYCSGVIPTGTGFLMNNAMGELELLGDGDLVPGDRLVSNMAPTVAFRGDGAVLAVGSPGATRITSALAQVMSAVMLDGTNLKEAVLRPRLHVEVDAEEIAVSVEPGVDTRSIDLPIRRFDTPHMYFGGVGAALRHPDGSLEAVADPRRDGAAGVGP